MEKKPLTMKQKIKAYNLGLVIAYVVLIFGLLMNGLYSPLTWIGFGLAVALSIFRVFTIRCPKCDELIPSNFGVVSKSCPKCGWHVDKTDESEAEQDA